MCLHLVVHVSHVVDDIFDYSNLVNSCMILDFECFINNLFTVYLNDFLFVTSGPM